MSINKRDIDNEISENEINKKQKIDNSGIDSNNDNNYSSIEISNLKQHTVIKLKEIADSIGVQNKSNVKKQDLIDQITFLINKKQETIKQKENDDNLNSFNKVVVEFKIKDGVDNLEWLFWKIFRNKFIYKRIMSFMDTHITQKYESITRVDRMIQSNQLYILRDKVIRNQYLVFDEMINSIFNHFKQDELFYKSLFKNYNRYILGFNEISNGESKKQSKNNHETIIKQLINSSNLVALNILIQDYNFKPTNRNLDYSIINGKLKFIKLFLQPKFNLKVKEPIDYFTEQLINPNVYKSLNYLHDEKLLQLNSISSIKSCISIDEKTKLKELISIIKFIINSTTEQQIQQLIDLNQFTKEELKLEITSASLANHKQSLKSLIEFYYKFGKSVKSNYGIPATDLFYHLYLCDNESGVDKLNSDGDHILDKLKCNNDTDKFKYYIQLSLQCSSFKTLHHVLLRYYKIYEESLNDFIYSNHLFAFCKQQDKEKQTKFIDFAIKVPNAINYILCFKDFIRILIVYDDVELVKYYLNGISNLFKLNDNISKIKNITSYINSNEMLEYLFDQFYSVILNSIFSFNNVQLLYKFEELYKKKFTNNTQIIYNNHIYPTNKFNSKEILIHILSTPSIYKIQSENLYNIIQQSIGKFSYEAIFQMCKLVYLNYQLVENYIFNGDTFHDLKRSIGFIKFIDWLFINNKQEDINHYFKYVQLVLLIPAGIYNSVSNDKEIPITELYDYSKFNENIKLLDYYLNRLVSTLAIEFNKINGKDLVFDILSNCIGYGRLKSLEHIYQNHNWVFRTSIPKKPSSSSNNNVINGYTTTKRHFITFS